ncbi:MAG: cysteine desulfurase [Bacteroidetes bacterium]|nr:cysteine desulfurase [Bacteroidota bacterium]
MKQLIYCDNNATTALDPRVLEKMMPWLTTQYGNASARIYPLGRNAYEAVESSRLMLADFLNADKEEISFTSGSTESINLAMRGVFDTYKSRGKHILICRTEHNAVIETACALERQGAEIEYINVDENGMIKRDELEKQIRKDTLLTCVMLLNNETGTVQPIEEVSELVRRTKSFLLCDATQAPGRINFPKLNQYADLIALSAHKLYGPKGVGVLYAKRKNPRVSLTPQLTGGNQELGLRAGTLNVPGIVGFGAAVSLLNLDELQRIQSLRDRFEYQVTKHSSTSINSKSVTRACNTSSITFMNHTAQELILLLQDIAAVSTGAACSSTSDEPSHVLLAMGHSPQQALSTLRFSFGRFNTVSEIDSISEKLQEILTT